MHSLVLGFQEPKVWLLDRPASEWRVINQRSNHHETLPKLTPTQVMLLRVAALRADGRVIPPANLYGGAGAQAVSELLRREWIEAGDGAYVLTGAGYAVAGRKRRTPPEDIHSNFWRASRSAPAPSSLRWWWRHVARRARLARN